MKTAFPLFALASADFPSWAEYKAEYGLTFNGDEDLAHEGNYVSNLALIDETNNQELGFTLGVNQFSAFSVEEFQANFMGEDASDELPAMIASSDDVEVAASQDWSTRTDIVNPVKDQGHCGSCWAFGANAALETEYALSTGTLHNLAEQQLVDCDTGSSGCQGGLSRNSFSGYYKTHGACSTASYAYKATDGTCKDTSCDVLIPSGVVMGYTEVGATTSALQAALMNRPLKVSVYGDTVWQSYSNGIAVPTTCYTRTNHAVMAVGYESGNYWKIRNSWGGNWGESGYIRLTQTSSCSTGPSSIWGRTPVYPTLSTLDVTV